eukprot:7846559-Pyramimonas_sp.AAC.1
MGCGQRSPLTTRSNLSDMGTFGPISARYRPRVHTTVHSAEYAYILSVWVIIHAVFALVGQRCKLTPKGLFGSIASATSATAANLRRFLTRDDQTSVSELSFIQPSCEQPSFAQKPEPSCSARRQTPDAVECVT